MIPLTRDYAEELATIETSRQQRAAAASLRWPSLDLSGFHYDEPTTQFFTAQAIADLGNERTAI